MPWDLGKFRVLHRYRLWDLDKFRASPHVLELGRSRANTWGESQNLSKSKSLHGGRPLKFFKSHFLQSNRGGEAQNFSKSLGLYGGARSNISTYFFIYSFIFSTYFLQAEKKVPLRLYRQRDLGILFSQIWRHQGDGWFENFHYSEGSRVQKRYVICQYTPVYMSSDFIRGLGGGSQFLGLGGTPKKRHKTCQNPELQTFI